MWRPSGNKRRMASSPDMRLQTCHAKRRPAGTHGQQTERGPGNFCIVVTAQPDEQNLSIQTFTNCFQEVYRLCLARADSPINTLGVCEQVINKRHAAKDGRCAWHCTGSLPVCSGVWSAPEAVHHCRRSLRPGPHQASSPRTERARRGCEAALTGNAASAQAFLQSSIPFCYPFRAENST